MNEDGPVVIDVHDVDGNGCRTAERRRVVISSDGHQMVDVLLFAVERPRRHNPSRPLVDGERVGEAAAGQEGVREAVERRRVGVVCGDDADFEAGRLVLFETERVGRRDEVRPLVVHVEDVDDYQRAACTAATRGYNYVVYLKEKKPGRTFITTKRYVFQDGVCHDAVNEIRYDYELWRSRIRHWRCAEVQVIQQVASFKLHAVYITDKPTWKVHVEYMRNRSEKKAFVFNRSYVIQELTLKFINMTGLISQ